LKVAKGFSLLPGNESFPEGLTKYSVPQSPKVKAKSTKQLKKSLTTGSLLFITRSLII
jgi:hypothetical protein